MFRSLQRRSPGPNADAARVKRLAGILASACLLLVFVPPVFMAGYVALADAGSIASSVDLMPSIVIVQSELRTWQRVIGVLVVEIPVVLTSLAMWEARRCFLAFARGEMFTMPAVRCLRRFAGWLLASTVASALITPIMSVVLTANNAPGTRVPELGFSSDHLLMLPRIAMMWLLAAVIAQGSAMAERSAAT